MADEQRTVILDFQVDQSKAVKDLEKTESAILDLKEQQSALNKEYKKGEITQEEYVRENLKLQQSLKREGDQKRTLNKLLETESNSRNALKARVALLTKEYDNLNQSTATGVKRAQQLEKELKDLNEQLIKGSKSAGLFKQLIGNYPEALDKMAESVDIAGVSLADIGGKLASFAGPAGIATAAIGVVGGLAAAYANSAAGARDLEFAQNLLSASTGILSERFADMTGAGEKQIGLLTQLTGAFLAYVDVSLAGEAALKAAAKERLKDLEISRAFAAGFAKEDERRAELQRRIRDDETKSLQDRLAASKLIDPILDNSKLRTITVIQAQIKAIKESTQNYKLNREAQLEVANLESEILDKQEEITGKLTENVTARNALLKLIQEEARLRELVRKQGGRSGVNEQATLEGENFDPFADAGDEFRKATGTDKIGKERIDATAKIAQAELDIYRSAYQADLKAKEAYNELKIESDKQTVSALGIITGEATQLFDESTGAYKVLATASTLISTYSAAQKAYESLVGIPFTGPALAAAAASVAVAQGLERVAAINGVEFAEGGYTGDGAKYDVAGVVHKGEYVTPKHLVESPAARPHLQALERMRTGYADGGFVVNTNTFDANQSLAVMNAIKMLPAPIVGVREFAKVQNRVEVKESASRR